MKKVKEIYNNNEKKWEQVPYVTDKTRVIYREGEIDEQGKKQGLWTEYWRGTKYKEETYKDGERHGNFITFHLNNGAKWEEGQYINGKRNGEYKSYYSNGAKWVEGQYANGKGEGPWIEYDENGKKLREEYYHKDNEITKEEWQEIEKEEKKEKKQHKIPKKSKDKEQGNER